jgi:hypothetical protein
MMSDVVYEAVSLGDSCETKFQIARKLNAEGHPGRSEMAFRLELALPGRGQRLFGWDMFDWQGPPLAAVCEYLERDFRGVFEREDLEVVDGAVMHRWLGTNHVHNFPGADDNIAQRIDRLYAVERIQFDRRAEAFRRRLESPGPCLYIHHSTAFPTPSETERLIAALRARSPEHRFHLLFIAFMEHDQDLSAFEGLVTKAARGSGEVKPKGREWEGNDDAWDAALALFRIAPPAAFEAALAPFSANTPGAGSGQRWASLDAVWRSLIPDSPLDSPTPPFVGQLPSKGWDYGVISSVIDPGHPMVIRLSVTVAAGCAGVAMVSPVGDQLLSEEMPVASADGRVEVLLPLSPESGPAAILLRNFDAEGEAGHIEVHEAVITSRDALTPAEALRTLEMRQPPKLA